MRLTFSSNFTKQYVMYHNITVRYLFVSQCFKLLSLNTVGLNLPYLSRRAGMSMAKIEVNLSFVEYMTSQSQVNLENLIITIFNYFATSITKY